MGEAEEFFGEVFCLQAGVFGVGEGVRVKRVFREGDAAKNGGEEVVEIVGEAAGELADGFKPIGFDELVGRETHFCGIAEDDDETAGLAGLIKGGTSGPENG